MHNTQPTTRGWRERSRPLVELLHRWRGILSSPLMRRVWQALTVLSIIAAALSTAYVWEELQAGILHFAPRYLVLAIALYIVTYIQRLFGWQATATYFFGRLSFRDNAEAVAASTLLKFLPTVAWYIANRVHFYTQREIPRRAVIAASLYELVAMTASGAVLYGGYWLTRHASPLAFIAASLSLGLIAILCRPSGAIRTWWRARIVSNIAAPDRDAGRQRLLWRAFLWYGSSWVVSFGFFWAVGGVLSPFHVRDVELLLDAWLLANLANNVLSFTLGAIPIAREATLAVLLARFWPWPVAVGVVALVKIFFTLGDIVCSAAVLGWMYVVPRRTDA